MDALGIPQDLHAGLQLYPHIKQPSYYYSYLADCDKWFNAHQSFGRTAANKLEGLVQAYYDICPDNKARALSG